MSDGRITSTPSKPSRCPVCDGAISTTPSARCPACGRTFAGAGQVGVPDLRLASQDWPSMYDKPVYFAFGLAVLVAVLLLAYPAPGILIPLAVLLVPAIVRTIRLANRPAVDEIRSPWGYLLGAIIASLGVAALAGLASTVTFCCVCVGITLTAPSKGGAIIGVVVGIIVGVAVFLLIFIKLWPRDRADERPASPDPEN